MSTIFSLWLAAKTVEVCSVTMLLCDTSMTMEQQGILMTMELLGTPTHMDQDTPTRMDQATPTPTHS